MLLSRIGRILWRTVKWTFLVVVALFSLLVLINLRDETLSDEARVLLETKPIEVPDNENIFVAMAGFNAPEGGDIFEAGRKRIERVKRQLEQDPTEFRIAFKEFEEGEALRLQEAEPPFDCRISKETDFWECIHSQKESLEKTLAANNILNQRHRLLQELPHYVTPQVPNSWFIASINISSPLMAQAVLDMERGNTEAGMSFFKKDMALWRRVLEGKSYFFDKMLASSRMMRDVYGLSLLLSSPSFGLEGQETEWRELLMPLSHKQANMRPAVEGEIRFMNNFLQKIRWISYQEATEQAKLICQFSLNSLHCSVLRRWLWLNFPNIFIKPNAAFNYAVPFYKAWLKLADLSWQDYLDQRDEVLALLEERYKPGIGWVYNPVWKNQLHQGLYMFDEHFGRLRDLDAYLRMVRLQLELRLANLPPEEIPSFIEQLDEVYCAPCTDFSWDAETRMLSFQPYDEKWFTRFVPASVYVPE